MSRPAGASSGITRLPQAALHRQILEGQTAAEARYVGSIDARGKILGVAAGFRRREVAFHTPLLTLSTLMPFLKRAVWIALACGAAISLGAIASNRGEHINSLWLVAAAACTYLIGYRFYGKFIAARVMALDDRRATPAERLENGHDFVPTNKWILFGHHFAAIAGPGPLVGPVVAAQFGYLPGTLWIIAGAVLGGAVQDFVILFASMRRDGKSLGQMARDEIGSWRLLSHLITVLMIMIVLLAVVGLVVVNALVGAVPGARLRSCSETMPVAHPHGSLSALLAAGARCWNVRRLDFVADAGVSFRRPVDCGFILRADVHPLRDGAGDCAIIALRLPRQRSAGGYCSLPRDYAQHLRKAWRDRDAGDRYLP